MADNATAITNFAGNNLEIDGNGVLNATVPMAVGGWPFVEDANSPNAFDGDSEHEIMIDGTYDRVWLTIDFVDFDATSSNPGGGLRLVGVNGQSLSEKVTGTSTTGSTLKTSGGIVEIGTIARASGAYIRGTMSFSGRWPADTGLDGTPSNGTMFMRNIDLVLGFPNVPEELAVTDIASPLRSLTFDAVSADPTTGATSAVDFEIRGRMFGDSSPAPSV